MYRVRGLLIPLVVLTVVTGQACGQSPTPYLTLATTTSVGNSGLLDVLLPEYLEQTKTATQSHLVGSGRALAMLEAGQADVVISHAPAAERSALQKHPDWWYRKIMFNDFVVAGPAVDPARIRGQASVRDAMRAIAAAGQRFISRGDQSGTHEREEQLWTQAGARPDRGRLVAAGAGMGTTLRVASESGAYTLTDRATFAQNAGALKLAILFEGGPELVNTYAVIVDPSGPRGDDARAFGEWLASGGGRHVISGYRLPGGIVAFEPWPQGRPAGRPEERPR